jgi:hypothetical protein
MTLAATPGAAEGTIAPAGGCPGNFFTSRKWTFEHDMLIIRDHKSEALAELSFAAGRFQGKHPAAGPSRLLGRSFSHRCKTKVFASFKRKENSCRNISSTASLNPGTRTAPRLCSI